MGLISNLIVVKTYPECGASEKLNVGPKTYPECGANIKFVVKNAHTYPECGADIKFDCG